MAVAPLRSCRSGRRETSTVEAVISTISSRTPEGEPNRCPLCGADFDLEPSQPSGDAPCPGCGQLLWWFQRRFHLDDLRNELLHRLIDDLAGESLDVVELVMELEEEFDLDIPDEEAEKIKTVAQAIAYIQRKRREREA